MTTQAESDMLGSESLDHESLLPAARSLAESLGIDAEPERAEPWPIDVGQRSIIAEFNGAVSGTIYLSIAEGDADRLIEDVEGADGVVRELIAGLGVPTDGLATKPFEPAADLPAIHVVVRNDEKIAGFGVSLAATGGVADATVQAQSFEPAPMASSPGVPTGLGAPISLLSDVDMQVTVELGRTTLPVRELLSLQPGMVVELERQAGAPIDVMVNGRLIARGEVVVLDEQFGLRVTEIVGDGGVR